MNGHPHEPLSDLELHNFSIFLKANPHLTRPAPQAAFDAMPKNIRRVSGKPLKTLVKDFRKGGKFDATRFALDAESDDVVSPGRAGMAFLRELASKLSPEGWAALRDACTEGETGDDEEDDNERAKLSDEELAELKRMEAKDRRAKDAPPSFPGMPKPGGEKAEDRALSGFASRFADASRVTVAVPVHAKPKKQVHAMDSKKGDSFASRFPGAAAVRVGG